MNGDPVPGYLHPRRLRAVLIWALADTGIGAVLVLGSPARVSSHAAAGSPTVGLLGCISYLAIAVTHLLFAVDQV